MSALTSLRDRLRSLLGDQRPRKLPRRGPKPRIGSYVVHVGEGVRMRMQAGMSDELWKWLMDHGWRVVPHHPDRRHYREVPASVLTRLIDSGPDMRFKLMAEAIALAEHRAPQTTRPPVP